MALRASPDGGKWQNIRGLEESLAELDRAFGSWHIAWGETNRLQRVDTRLEESFSDQRPSLPIPGGGGELGIVFHFKARRIEGQKRRYGYQGHSLVAVAEFGPEVRAQSVLVFGQSEDPESPHYFDQAELYATKRFKPVWFTPADVKANAVREYHPGEAP